MLEVLALTGPIYLLIAAGYLATRLGWFARADMRVFGKYVIQLALPALLFNALSQRRLAEVLNPVFLVAYTGGALLVMLAGIAWARRAAGKPLSAAAIMGMGMSCPNSGFIGFPLAVQVVGPAAAGVALALAMVVENALLLPLAIAIGDSGLEEGAGGGRAQRWRAALGQSSRALLRNPMIHGIVLGLVFAAFEWRLPEPAARAVHLLAMSSAAVSLLVIGGSLVGVRPQGLVRDVSAIVVGKLLLHPLAVVALVWLLPPMQRELQLAVILMAAVPMLSIYPILAQKHGHESLAAAAQLGATVASFFTLTALVWLLQRG